MSRNFAQRRYYAAYYWHVGDDGGEFAFQELHEFSSAAARERWEQYFGERCPCEFEYDTINFELQQSECDQPLMLLRWIDTNGYHDRVLPIAHGGQPGEIIDYQLLGHEQFRWEMVTIPRQNRDHDPDYFRPLDSEGEAEVAKEMEGNSPRPSPQ